MLRYTGNPRDLFNNELFSEDYYCSKVTEHHIQYATFLDMLNNTGYQLNYYDLKEMFYNKFIDTGTPNMESYTDFINTFSLKNSQKKIIMNILKSGRLQRSSELVLLISVYLMFYDVKDFERYAEQIGFSKFDCENYVVAGKYRKNISLIQHNCGCKFVGTEYGIKKGWGCPDCLSKFTPNEFANHLFKSAYPEGYSIVEPYKPGTASMVMRHDICGQIKITTFFELLYAPICKCLRTRNSYLVNNGTVKLSNIYKTYESKKIEHNINLEKEKSDFRVLEYFGAFNPVIIRHSICGKTFSVSQIAHFFSKKRCPYCKYTSTGTIISADSFLHKAEKGKKILEGNLIHGPITHKDEFIGTIKSLVGDDYELIGEYTDSNSSITLRHNLCGHTFTTTGSRFCNGQRCKCETFYTNDETFMEAFRECTDNCYGIIKDASCKFNYFRITEKTTGKVATLSKAQLIQELNRVTPSAIIDNEHRHMFKGGLKPVKRVYMKMLYHILLEHSDENRIFSLGDIKKYCDYTSSQLSKAMTGFKKKGVVMYTGNKGCYRILNTRFYIFDSVAEK